MKDKTVAIITARGGSKRIPRKNIKTFAGRPIIEYSIQTALGSGLFSEVMVSTDDKEIADVAEQAGATIPFLRSARNSDDFTGTADVLCEVIDSYKAQGKFFSKGCCIYPTAPFVNINTLNEGHNLFNTGNYDVVFPVVKYSYPIQRSLRVFPDSRCDMLWPENYLKRSQDLEAVYHDAGQFYWFDTDSLMKNKMLQTGNTGVIVINELEAQDIDTEDDWKLAEFKYALMLERSRKQTNH